MPPFPPLPDTQAAFEQIIRRHRRKQRVARAEGVLHGVLSMLRPGDVVVDLGANVGKITGQLAATGAQVHAFEPDPWTFAELHRAVGALPNVTLWNAAAGAVAGRMTLRRSVLFSEDPRRGSVGSTLIEGSAHSDPENTAEVEVIDMPAFLGSLIAQHGEIAFLKMDIEGAELDLLDRMETAPGFEAIRLTLVETHEFLFPALRPRYRDLRSRLGATWPATRINLDWI